MEEEKTFLEYLMQNQKHRHWYPVVLATWRIPECVLGDYRLALEDIDFDEGLISVNHSRLL